MPKGIMNYIKVEKVEPDHRLVATAESELAESELAESELAESELAKLDKAGNKRLNKLKQSGNLTWYKVYITITLESYKEMFKAQSKNKDIKCHCCRSTHNNRLEQIACYADNIKADPDSNKFKPVFVQHHDREYESIDGSRTTLARLLLGQNKIYCLLGKYDN